LPSASHTSNSQNADLSPLVLSAIQFINKRYHKIDSVQDISTGLSVNYNTLRVKFRRETKQTLKEFLTRIRLKRALALFPENKQLKEIAWEVGYGDENQFIRAFRRIYKTKPNEIRRRNMISQRTDDVLDWIDQLK